MKPPKILLLFLLPILMIFACEVDQSKKKHTEASVSQPEDSTKINYVEKGKLIAGSTFTALSGNLQEAMSKGGVAEAIQYCNIAAMPLVDSLSKIHNAQIRRTSLKVRNPLDKPTELEKKMLESYESKANMAESLKPIVQETEESIYFFAPIKINNFCLQCHGKVGGDITVNNYEVIKKHYPDDEAIGYVDGDLRGMWSIQFKKH